MSDYTPTTEEVVEALETGVFHHIGYGTRRMNRAEFMRWLERQREDANLDGRIDERATSQQPAPEDVREDLALVLFKNADSRREWENFGPHVKEHWLAYADAIIAEFYVRKRGVGD